MARHVASLDINRYYSPLKKMCSNNFFLYDDVLIRMNHFIENGYDLVLLPNHTQYMLLHTD